MDRVMIADKAKELFGKYKYVLLILALGIFLMSIPDRDDPPAAQAAPTQQTVPESREEELEAILGQISGVGKVRVLLTEASGAETIYQADEDHSTSSDSGRTERQTVIITDSDRTERGLVRTVTPPVYLGAIVVCQGGDSPTVRLSIVEAVSNVTGISSDRITVLKMK